MKKTIYKICSYVLIGVMICLPMISLDKLNVHAAQTLQINNTHFEVFGEDWKYTISDTTAMGTYSNPLGSLSITGDMSSVSDVNGYASYEVKSDVIKFNYTLGSDYSGLDEYSWHIISDKTKDFDGIKLDSNIQKGALIVQTSFSGENWLTESIYTDIAGEKSTFTSEFYSSKPVQQVNGCYYRIIVLYELERKSQNGTLLHPNDNKKCAEVYYIYLISSEANGDTADPNAEPRMELGTKINTGKDNGYSGYEAIDNDDPHFNMDIGTFYVNGYTRSTTDSDNTIVFIKKLGDRVTLWFNLQENIYALKGDSNIYVQEDTNGYDQYFEVDNINFKRGTLIIRYTDYQGVRHKPVVFTDYLAACSTTGANTRVELFEEGDYEVALDYEIKDERGINTVDNYRIFFTFKIRNGNCMAFPFDTVTKKELSDGAITSNGFYLDLAQSRYLTINVIRYSLKLSDGIYVTDSRNNSPAKDGDTYTQEGVYQFSVKNLYTDAEDTSKTIYVGSSPIYRALARGIYSLDEINQMLLEGGVLESDGSITMPVPVVEEPDEPIDEQVDEKPSEIVVEEVETVDAPVDEQTIVIQEEITTDSDDIDDRTLDESENKSNSLVWIILVIIVIVGCVVAFIRYKGKQTDNNDTLDTGNTNVHRSSDKYKENTVTISEDDYKETIGEEIPSEEIKTENVEGETADVDKLDIGEGTEK